MWDRIEPPMPADPVRGRRWADHRRTLKAIAWKYRTNSPWATFPTSSARSRPLTSG
ncbi:transposase [Streptomyces akebiae]|uniref:transposase n=1 Tax=Streptomyces akebiae TaxID=2865673 RepID=UPI0037D99D32